MRTLKKYDKVTFNMFGVGGHPSAKMEYTVRDNYMGYGGSNDRIFTLLGIDKMEFCKRAYGYPPERASFPACRTGDYEALTRCVDDLRALVIALGGTVRIGNVRGYRFGVEIEFLIDRGDVSKIQGAFRGLPLTLTNDESLRPDGGQTGRELLTAGGLKISELKKTMKKATTILNNAGASINTSCGLHIHTSHPQFMRSSYLEKAVGFWLAIEDVFIATQPPSRLNNNYCRRYLADKNPKDMTIPSSDIKAFCRQLGRYSALNLQSLHKHGTIENRLHSGTTDYKKIMSWVELNARFYKTVRRADSDKYLNMPTNNKKVLEVFDVLKLSKTTKKHFKDRIRSTLFKKLDKQRDSMIELKKIIPKLQKTLLSYDKIVKDRRDLERLVSDYKRIIGGKY